MEKTTENPAENPSPGNKPKRLASDHHVTLQDVVIVTDESAEMKQRYPGTGAMFTGRLNIQIHCQVPNEVWDTGDREQIREHVARQLRRSLLTQLYGDVWAMAGAVATYMARDTAQARLLGYPGARWVELLRNIGKIKPEGEFTTFQQYPLHAPPTLAAVVINENEADLQEGSAAAAPQLIIP